MNPRRNNRVPFGREMPNGLHPIDFLACSCPRAHWERSNIPDLGYADAHAGLFRHLERATRIERAFSVWEAYLALSEPTKKVLGDEGRKLNA